MRKFLREHLLCFAVMTVLLLANLVSWGTLYHYQAEHPADITPLGTFMTGGTSSSQPAVYLVFTQDGTLHRYRQGDEAKEGSYEQHGEFISVTGEMGEFQILIKGNRLFTWEKSGQLITYRFVDHRPVHISWMPPEA